MSDGAGGRRVEAASTAKGQILQRSKQKGIYLPPVDAAPLEVPAHVREYRPWVEEPAVDVGRIYVSTPDGHRPRTHVHRLNDFLQPVAAAETAREMSARAQEAQKALEALPAVKSVAIRLVDDPNAAVPLERGKAVPRALHVVLDEAQYDLSAGASAGVNGTMETTVEGRVHNVLGALETLEVKYGVDGGDMASLAAGARSLSGRAPLSAAALTAFPGQHVRLSLALPRVTPSLDLHVSAERSTSSAVTGISGTRTHLHEASVALTTPDQRFSVAYAAALRDVVPRWNPHSSFLAAVSPQVLPSVGTTVFSGVRARVHESSQTLSESGHAVQGRRGLAELELAGLGGDVSHGKLHVEGAWSVTLGRYRPDTGYAAPLTAEQHELLRRELRRQQREFQRELREGSAADAAPSASALFPPPGLLAPPTVAEVGPSAAAVHALELLSGVAGGAGVAGAGSDGSVARKMRAAAGSEEARQRLGASNGSWVEGVSSALDRAERLEQRANQWWITAHVPAHERDQRSWADEVHGWATAGATLSVKAEAGLVVPWDEAKRVGRDLLHTLSAQASPALLGTPREPAAHFVDRFHLGGPSLRGVPLGLLGPHGSGAPNSALGGDAKVAVSARLILPGPFPSYSIPFLSALRTHVFASAGAVVPRPLRTPLRQLQDWTAAVAGVGVVLPSGPAAIEANFVFASAHGSAVQKPPTGFAVSVNLST